MTCLIAHERGSTCVIAMITGNSAAAIESTDLERLQNTFGGRLDISPYDSDSLRIIHDIGGAAGRRTAHLLSQAIGTHLKIPRMEVVGISPEWRNN